MNDQLDLFRGSQSVRFVNEVVAALAARDAQRAGQVVGALRAYDADDSRLAALEFLIGALAGWDSPPTDAQAIAARVRWLADELAPAARWAIGDAAGPFVAAFFRVLAEPARGLAYAPETPTAHRAWLCLRCGAWADAKEAALAIQGAGAAPDALEWLACARYRRSGFEAARSALLALAWHSPSRFAAALAALRDERLDRDWQRFNGACEWDGVPDAELLAWFPAWYLLEHPAARGELDYFDAPATRPAEAARFVKRLLDLESRSDWHKIASARDKLRKLNEDLFALCMARRAVQLR